MTCEMESLAEILKKMEAPVVFALADGGKRVALIKNFESVMTSLSLKFQEQMRQDRKDLPRTGKIEEIAESLCMHFKNYDALTAAQKKERLDRAKYLLSELRIILENNAGPSLQNEPKGEVVAALNVDDNLLQPILSVRGIGPRLADRLARKSILTVEDLLFFIPRRYEDRRTICRISETIPNIRQTVVGRVVSADFRFYGRKRIFEVTVDDGSGMIKAKWLKGREAFLRNAFRTEARVILTGKITGFPFDRETIHPDFEILNGRDDQMLHFKRIVPVYSETEGLSQKVIRRIMWKVIRDFVNLIQSPVPDIFLKRHGLPEIVKALRQVHFPSNDQDIAAYREMCSDAHRRLIYDDFFFFQIATALKKREDMRQQGIAFKTGGILTAKFHKQLPFSLTGAQRRAIVEIEHDMGSPCRMNRLLQGDVGCGKTVVSMTAMLIACENGYQAAIMAPTEILAEQHFKTFKPWADDLGLHIELLTGGLKKSEREDALKRIKSGIINLIVGTHALIQEDIAFHNLGMVVIDEQHRFGVVQRAALRKKGVHPDVLVMTATPIPRTLSMTVYGDLDLSVIDETPRGKMPVETKVILDSQRIYVYQTIRREVKKGNQVFIVYPLVDVSESLDLKDAKRMAEHLRTEIFPDFRIGIVHGRMKKSEKDLVMADFREKKIDILVSTTVIEVGIDIPQASLMVIEHAERFGLSQLHQLRGRVGRGNIPSSCMLITHKTRTEDARKRLRIMEQTNDGFRIAEEDLAIRGPGEFMGIRQSGLPDFRIADIIRDSRIFMDARTDAFELVERDPYLESPEHIPIRKHLLRRWKHGHELAKTG